MGSPRLDYDGVSERRSPDKPDFRADGQAHLHETLGIGRLQVQLRDPRGLADSEMVKRSCLDRFHQSLFLRVTPPSNPCAPGMSVYQARGKNPRTNCPAACVIGNLEKLGYGWKT